MTIVVLWLKFSSIFGIIILSNNIFVLDFISSSITIILSTRETILFYNHKYISSVIVVPLLYSY